MSEPAQLKISENQPHTESRRDLESLESPFVGILCFILLCLSSYDLGVWESWESLHAHLIDWMWNHETWLQVHVPTSAEQAKVVGELAMGWWPSMLSVHFLGSSGWMSPELSLRLPSLMLGAFNVMVLFSFMKHWKNRTTALLSVALLLITPAFSLMSRHHLNAGGIGPIACSGAALCYWRASLDLGARAWRVLGSLLLILSAGSLGFIGLLLPLTAWLSVRDSRQSTKALILQVCRYLGPVVIILGIYGWRSWVKKPDGVDLWQLFVTIDPLAQVYDYSDWGGFQSALHLIGFGLFPLGALLPVLAYTLTNREETSLDSRRQNRELRDHQLGTALLLFFVVSFFSCSLLFPIAGYWGGAALLISTPMAIAAALFFGEWRASRHPPILYILSVLFFWLLIDSDLKREPGLLIGAITGSKTEGLLNEFPLWRVARYLTLIGLGAIVCFHTRAISHVKSILKERLFVDHSLSVRPVLICVSLLTALAAILPHLTRVIPRWIVGNAFVNAPFWADTSTLIRLSLLMLIIVFLTYYSLSVAWRAYTEKVKAMWWNRLDLEAAFCLSWLVITPHYLGRLPIWIFMRPLIPFMEYPQTQQPHYISVLLIHIGVIVCTSIFLIMMKKVYRLTVTSSLFREAMKKISPLLQWCTSRSSLKWRHRMVVSFWVVACLIFTQFFLPQGLSAQFSHQGLIRGYQAKMSDDKELSLYLVKDADRSYYLNGFSQLKKAQFEVRSSATERQFFIIGRDQLSRANGEFRAKTGAHLPVLDDQHHELLLASNTLLKGENDLNPIKNAVINTLPQNVHNLSEPINFENKIELVGWKLTPSRPRPGAPLKIDLFWKAKRRIRSHWKVFIHIDAPGQRVHADHEPVLGVYPTEDWQQDDLIIDTHHITVKRSIKPATFTFFAGLYRGKKRMKVLNTDSKVKGRDNRAILGKVVVQ